SVSATPSPSVSTPAGVSTSSSSSSSTSTTTHPVASTSEPAGVFAHLSSASTTPSLSASSGSFGTLQLPVGTLPFIKNSWYVPSVPPPTARWPLLRQTVTRSIVAGALNG